MTYNTSSENSSLHSVILRFSSFTSAVKIRCDDEARNAKGMIHRQRKELIEFVDIRKGEPKFEYSFEVLKP